MQRLLDFIFNVPKLWSKRYFVVFFDSENMPEEGNRIIVGDFEAIFKKISFEDEIPFKEDEKYESLPKVQSDPEKAWACRKCMEFQLEEPILDGNTQVLRCQKCGFRTVKQ